MAIESPLFQSAMELLGHSLSHYNGTKELDRKLVILHLANAVELILKDLVLDSGQSIYKGGSKETISIHACLTALDSKGIKLPFLNKIELLIDERNALQHRFGSPNQLTTIFYMNIAKEFFSDILRNHYGQDYDEIISQFADKQALVAYKLGEPSNDKELEKLQELATIHPLGALLSAWSYFEKTTEKFVADARLDFGRRMPFTMELTRGRLDKYGISVPEELRRKIDEIRNIRNMAAHGHADPTQKDVLETIKTIEQLEKYLQSLNIEGIRSAAKIEREKYESERMAYIEQRAEERLLIHETMENRSDGD